MAGHGCDVTPHYVPVSIQVNGNPEVSSWKAWKYTGSGVVTWEVLSFISRLLPNVDVTKPNFRLNKTFSKTFKSWVNRLPLEGVMPFDTYYPSYKSCSARVAAATSMTHSTPSITTFGFLSICTWCTTRTVGNNRACGFAVFRALLHATLPQLAEAELRMPVHFDDHKDRCQCNAVGGYCEHMRKLRHDWSHGDNVVTQLVTCMSEASDNQCLASWAVYTALLARLTELIQHAWGDLDNPSHAVLCVAHVLCFCYVKKIETRSHARFEHAYGDMQRGLIEGDGGLFQ
jgi:hypothetical protein